MSTCGVSQPLKGYVRDARRRRRVLNLDLNDVPSSDNTAAAADNSAAHDVGSRVIQSSGRLGGGDSSTMTTTPAAIDVDAIDDEVLFSSPRRFAEARERSRRNNEAPMVLVEGAGAHQGLSEERMTRMALNRYKKRRRVTSNQGYVNSELYINLEGDDNDKRKNTEKPPRPVKVQPPPPPPPPKELTFNCPVCMGRLVEEMSTKCGHIFCKMCIKASITAQNKCPTCRRKLSMKDTFRIYLPAAS